MKIEAYKSRKAKFQNRGTNSKGIIKCPSTFSDQLHYIEDKLKCNLPIHNSTLNYIQYFNHKGN